MTPTQAARDERQFWLNLIQEFVNTWAGLVGYVGKGNLTAKEIRARQKGPVGLAGSLAADALLHYLQNTGEDVMFSMKDLLKESPSVRAMLNSEVQKLMKTAQEHARTLPDGSRFRVVSSWSKAKPISRDESLDYFSLLRGYEWRLLADLKVSGARPKERCLAGAVRFVILKEYNFDKKETFPFPLGIQVPGKPLAELHEMGLAKEFDAWSYATSLINTPLSKPVIGKSLEWFGAYSFQDLLVSSKLKFPSPIPSSVKSFTVLDRILLPPKPTN